MNKEEWILAMFKHSCVTELESIKKEQEAFIARKEYSSDEIEAKRETIVNIMAVLMSIESRAVVDPDVEVD